MAQFNPYAPYSQFSQQNPYLVQPQPTNISNNGINWVQGIEGAKAWQMPQNSNAVLLDSENEGTFYIKTSDNVGMCNLRIFKYEEVTTQQKQSSNIDLSEYVKKSELEAMLASLLGGAKNEQSISATKSESKSGKLITK